MNNSIQSSISLPYPHTLLQEQQHNDILLKEQQHNEILYQKQYRLDFYNSQPKCINCTYFPTNFNLYDLIMAQQKVIIKMKLDLNNLENEYNILLSKTKFTDVGDYYPPSCYWVMYEHNKFLKAINLFGIKDAQSISMFIGTKTPSQVRLHSQNYIRDLKKQKLKRNNSSTNTNNQQVNSYENNINSSNYGTNNNNTNEHITDNLNIKNLFN